MYISRIMDEFEQEFLMDEEEAPAESELEDEDELEDEALEVPDEEEGSF